LIIPRLIFTNRAAKPPIHEERLNMPIPYIIRAYKSVSASSTGNATWTTGEDTTVIIYRIVRDSTGAFDITSIKDTNGTSYLSGTIPYLALGTWEEPTVLERPWVIPAKTTITFELLDTSAATNAVYIIGIGEKSLIGEAPAAAR